MSYIWFNEVLHAIGKKISFESISNLYGNSFAKDASKYIAKANPLLKDGNTGGSTDITKLTGGIKVIKSNSKDSAIKSAEKSVGDLSWIKDMFGSTKKEK